MDQELALEIELGRPPESFAKRRSLDLQLVGIIRVLVVASSAALKIRACRLNAVSRRLKQPLNSTPRESGFLLGQGNLAFFTLEYKRNENTLSRTTFIRLEPGESVSAINEFFDLQVHLEILAASCQL